MSWRRDGSHMPQHLRLLFGVLGITIITIDRLLMLFSPNLMFLIERNYSGNKNQHRKTKFSPSIRKTITKENHENKQKG